MRKGCRWNIWRLEFMRDGIGFGGREDKEDGENGKTGRKEMANNVEVEEGKEK